MKPDTLSSAPSGAFSLGADEPRGALPTGYPVNRAADRFAEADARMAQRTAEQDRVKRAQAQKRGAQGRFKR